MYRGERQQHEPIDRDTMMYSREKLLSLRAKQPISDDVFHLITNLGIRKRPRGRKGGIRVRRNIPVYKGTQLPSILLTNATSLKNKMTELKTLVKNNNTDIAAL